MLEKDGLFAKHDMTKHVYLVRHGETDSNVDGIARGDTAMLNDLGREQAATVAGRFEGLKIDALISSPYPRTMETSRFIEEQLHLPIEESAFFTEYRGPSQRLGLHRDDPEMRALTHEIFEGYLIPGHRHSDEENFEDLKERALNALAFLAAHPKQHIAVVTHNLFSRILFCAAVFGADFSGHEMRMMTRGLQMNNTGISHFEYKSDPLDPEKYRWFARAWNDTCHLG
jgi:broad specificity phosphatase PhoE